MFNEQHDGITMGTRGIPYSKAHARADSLEVEIMNPIKKEVVIGNCRLLLGDCVDVIPTLKINSIDMILCDLPYGTTQCSWDIIIPFQKLWPLWDRIVNDESPIVLFGSEPFSSELRLSNIKYFKYDWVWYKPKGTGFLNARKQPMRNHEIISVFYRKQCLYNPQKTFGHNKKISFRNKDLQSDVYGKTNDDYFYSSTERYPQSILNFSSDTQNSSLHPTQKPVALCEYLIKTYTKEGDIVLDNCMGSGTTAIACKNLNRDFIGIEMDENYFNIACERVYNAWQQPDMFIES